LTIRAVIFDFDGVLADTERLHFQATQDALASRGWTLDEATYFARYLGFGDRDLVVEFGRQTGRAIDDAAVEAIVAAKSGHYRGRMAGGDALFPTAAPCVRRLGTQFPLGIASGSLQAEIVDILTAGGLRDAFQAIVGADDVATGKPGPEPYVRAAALLMADLVVGSLDEISVPVVERLTARDR
jgi:beta-phosphoglucomutase-like phosphatase (HAD superfamily)